MFNKHNLHGLSKATFNFPVTSLARQKVKILFRSYFVIQQAGSVFSIYFLKEFDIKDVNFTVGR